MSATGLFRDSDFDKKETRAALPVERRNAADLSYEAYLRDYVAKNRPVVVEDAVKDWPALGKWTPEFFKAQFASKRVNISYDDQLSFADFIDAVVASTEEKPGPYMYRTFIGPHLPELLSDVRPQNAYAFPRRLASPLMPRAWRRLDGYLKLLIGGVGGKFPVMHFDGDNMHACITEIYGDKEFIMYPPEDTPFVYPKPEMPNQTQIRDLRQPDFARFPLFAKATQYQTILRPGEMIFVPSRWWHTARVISTSISVCQNMLDASNWNGYVECVCGPDQRIPMLKRLAGRFYFGALGTVLSLLEKQPWRGTVEGSYCANRFASLAPTNRWETVDVRDWPVHKWIVR